MNREYSFIGALVLIGIIVIIIASLVTYNSKFEFKCDYGKFVNKTVVSVLYEKGTWKQWQTKLSDGSYAMVYTNENYPPIIGESISCAYCEDDKQKCKKGFE